MAFWLSLRTAFVSTAICLLIGYPMARLASRARRSVGGVPLLLALMLPFWTGFLMRINAWISGMLRDDGSWINIALVTFLGFAPGIWLLGHKVDTALYIGMVYTYLPFMVLPIYARLAKLDATLLDAAADLGASPFRAFPARHVAAVTAGHRRRCRAGLHSGGRRIRHPRVVGRPRSAVDRAGDVGGVF